MTQAQLEVKKLETHLYTETKGGLRIKNPATLLVSPTEIEFVKSAFHLKGEIKAMQGARWLGYRRENPKKVWTVDNCPRNWFQLKYLMGQNPYEWFDQDLVQYEYEHPLRDHQKLMADTGLTYHYQIWGAEMGTGKLNRMSTPILTPVGWTTMGQLKVGSRLVDPDGGECSVLSLHPQGSKEIFRVTFTDGSSNDCGAEHLWRVTTPLRKWRGQNYQILTTKELVAHGLQYSNGNNKWFIPMVEPVQFDFQPLECHPYVMGYILGNGYMPSYRVSIPDQETVGRLNSLMQEPLRPEASTLRGEGIDYTIKCPHTRKAIDEYGLKECRSGTKFIPQCFLLNTIENRTYLMQGLLDSDGTPIHSSGIEFCSASKNLSDGMKFLVQSFGGTCHYELKEFPTYKDETLVGKPSHRLHGSFHFSITPFLLSRKANRYIVPTKYQSTRAIVSVKSVGFDEAICIRVDSDTHCYVTDEFIVTHNTLSAQSVMEMSAIDTWFWVGPLKSLENIEIEWEKWDCKLTWTKPKSGKALAEAVQSGEHNIHLTTYERLVKYMEVRSDSDPLPGGVIFDESSRLKSPTAQRSRAAQDLSDKIRAAYGTDGFVILMSGTPSPKSPLDWWKQCLMGDTWVMTAEGPTQIKDIVDIPVDIWVNNKLINTKGFYKSGHKQVFKLTTKEGYSVESTSDHRFKKFGGGWCELYDLEVGDTLELANSELLEWSGEGSFNDGYLLGFTLGDGGWYYKDNYLYGRISVYGDKKHLCQNLLDCLPAGYTPTGEDPVRFHHDYLNKLSRKFGFTPNKEIPPNFESQVSSACLKGFLRGLFDTDGSVDYNRLRVTVAQVNLERILSVQRLLSHLGIYCKLQTKRVLDGIIGSRKIKGSGIVFILHITGDDAIAFHDRIGFSHVKKADKLEDRIKRRHKHSSQRFATVQKIEETGEKDTFDIEVPGEHCFSANGLLAHNCEITWPGFLREGSKDQLESRLGFLVRQELPDNVINVRIGWKDNEGKCGKCAKLLDEGDHAWDMDAPDKPHHDWEASKNEVAYMYERLHGLVTIIHKKDVLDLPDKVYEIDWCEPSPSTLRVAKTLAKAAPNVMTGITWLRELSDGFMYKNVPDGLKGCPTCMNSEEAGKVKTWFSPKHPDEPIRAIDMLEEEYVNSLVEQHIECPRCNGLQQINKMRRVAKEVPCPKEAKLKTRLAQCEETGRIVIFAGFQGSIDRIRGICKKSGWDVVQCDGRGWRVFDKTGKTINTDKPLSYWSDLEHHQQVAFVAHPQSGGLSLNLTEARMTVYWSNDFNPESRAQSEDRIHRMGMDENKGCKIVDLYHLPTDEQTHNILKENRKLELLTMGEINRCLDA